MSVAVDDIAFLGRREVEAFFRQKYTPSSMVIAIVSACSFCYYLPTELLVIRGIMPRPNIMDMLCMAS